MCRARRRRRSRTEIVFVIPGWSEGPDPESRDSGFARRRAPRNDAANFREPRLLTAGIFLAVFLRSAGDRVSIAHLTEVSNHRDGSGHSSRLPRFAAAPEE